MGGGKRGRGNDSAWVVGKHTHKGTSICTSSGHPPQPHAQVELFVRALLLVMQVELHACSPTTSAAWFQTARSPAYGDPWVKGPFRLIILATMITDLCFSFLKFRIIFFLKNPQTSRNLNAVFVWTINNIRRLIFKNVKWCDFLKVKSDIGIYEFCSWNNSNGFNLGCSFYSLEWANSN